MNNIRRPIAGAASRWDAGGAPTTSRAALLALIGGAAAGGAVLALHGGKSASPAAIATPSGVTISAGGPSMGPPQ